MAALALNRNCLQTRMMTNRHRNRCLPTPVVFILIRELTSWCQHAVWCSRMLNTDINVSPNRTHLHHLVILVPVAVMYLSLHLYFYVYLSIYFWSLHIPSIWCQHWCCIGEGFRCTKRSWHPEKHHRSSFFILSSHIFPLSCFLMTTFQLNPSFSF